MQRALLAIGFLATAGVGASTLDGKAWISRLTATPSQERQIEVVPVRHDGARITLTKAQAAKAQSAGLLPAGALSILNIRGSLKHGDFAWNDQGVSPGRIQIRVDLGRQLISVFQDGHEIGTAVILYGAEDKHTPVGRFPIQAKLRDHRSSLYDAPMPYTMRLTNDGVSLHGSTVRQGAGTHGCVGLPEEFARRLFDKSSVGDIVEIVG